MVSHPSAIKLRKDGVPISVVGKGWATRLRPVRVPASALDLGELGHELAAVDLAGDGLTLRVKAQPARALAVG